MSSVHLRCHLRELALAFDRWSSPCKTPQRPAATCESSRPPRPTSLWDWVSSAQPSSGLPQSCASGLLPAPGPPGPQMTTHPPPLPVSCTWAFGSPWGPPPQQEACLLFPPVRSLCLTAPLSQATSLQALVPPSPHPSHHHVNHYSGVQCHSVFLKNSLACHPSSGILNGSVVAHKISSKP